MKRKPLILRLMAFLLAALMLTGCSQEAIQSKLSGLEGYLPSVPKNRTISKDSKWIDSSIDGSIDADTPTNVKDDFYTAVNRDFLLEPLPEGTKSLNLVTFISEPFADKLKALYTMDPENVAGTDSEILSPEKLTHIQELVHYLYAQGEDVQGRTEDGVEPLRPFLESIESISSMEELTAYFRNEQGQNLFGIQLAPFTVQAPFTDRAGENYTVMILPQAELALQDNADYAFLTPDGFGSDLYNRELLGSILGRLGYSTSQIDALLAGCYRFECKLARCLPSASELRDSSYWTENDTVYTREELDALCGSFPLETILDECGLGNSETYTVPCGIQLEELGRVYRDKNLADIKAYLEVHTVLNAVSLLDDNTNDLAVESKRQVERTAQTTTQEEMTEEEKQDAARQTLFNRFVSPFLLDAFQQMYVAHYCTAQQKQDLTELVLRIQGAFRQTLENSDWLGEETRAEALAKLDNMGLHVLYPDNLIDYTSLSFDGCENLLDAVARINRFNMDLQTGLVNQKVDRSNWDLTQIPTTMVNAMYNPTDNSINILAGFLASDEVYGIEKTIEENLAGIGTVIGHEITHGFDTSGYAYDQDGHYRMWWTDEDRLSFDTRAANLIRFYSGLAPVADNSYLDGNNLSGEAIADMGGMKSALTVAKSIPDFDYDLFFRSYAKLWRTHNTYMVELMSVSDEHPLGMLRTNVTVSQFDEFQKTYDIQPGDGMYVAAENRILVW